MNLTDSFIQLLNDIAEESSSSVVLHQIKRCLLDYVGVTFAGRKALGIQLNDAIAVGEDGKCSIIGTGIKKDIYTACIANGFAAHVLELDDGNRIGAPHLEASIITAMIAIVQKESLSYEAFIKGIVIGYEAVIRLSSSIQPSHKMKGFHSTGTCGTIGVACAIGYALGYSQEQIKCSISAAASSASGLLQVHDDGSQLKPYNVANAIVNGITAAIIGKCNFAFPVDAIGGKRGFLCAFADKYTEERLIGNRGMPEIFQIYVKPYAACRHSHAAVECTIYICTENHIEPADILDIEIQTYKLALYGHDQINIESTSSAKMSIPYSVAAAAVLGTCGIEAFDEKAISNDEIKCIARKVHMVENERLSKEYPFKRGAIVKITLINGSSYEYEVEYPLGEPENNISDDNLASKYSTMMQYAGVNKQVSERIKDAIWHLEDRYMDFIALVTEEIIPSDKKQEERKYAKSKHSEH